MLYKIKPYDTNSEYPSITVHMGRLKKFTLDNTRRFMPTGLRTDPDKELEEMTIEPDPTMGPPSPPPAPEYTTPRGARIVGPPLRRQRPSWQDEEEEEE